MMLKKIITFFFLGNIFACIVHAGDFYLLEKFKSGQAGDFVVTAQDNTYSLLLIRKVEQEILLLEEIAIPSEQINLKSINWRTWLSKNAPGHTCWTMYEIDLKKKLLLECFSHSKNGWIHLDEQEQFFAKLLTLCFDRVSDAEKKRIGPPPPSEEPDHRKIWTPPLMIDGKKRSGTFEVMRARWPEDNSPLASCHVELYFDADHPSFAFPYWLELKSPHYAFKVRVVESGQGLISPKISTIPHRLPKFAPNISIWTPVLQAPSYYEAFSLSLCDITSKKNTPIAHRMRRLEEKERLALDIEPDQLKPLLQPGHKYQWEVRSDKFPSSIRSDVFMFKEL